MLSREKKIAVKKSIEGLRLNLIIGFEERGAFDDHGFFLRSDENINTVIYFATFNNYQFNNYHKFMVCNATSEI